MFTDPLVKLTEKKIRDIWDWDWELVRSLSILKWKKLKINTSVITSQSS